MIQASVSEAAYGAPLTVPGEFLGSPELPLSSFLHKIENAVTGFGVSLPHYVRPSPPHQLPPALMSARYVFVREDTSVPSLWLLCTMGLILFLNSEEKSSASCLVPELMWFL